MINSADGGAASNLNNTVTINSIQSLSVVNIIIDSPTETPTRNPFSSKSSLNAKNQNSSKYYSLIVIIVIPISILIYVLCRRNRKEKDVREPETEEDEENTDRKKNFSQNILPNRDISESFFEILEINKNASASDVKRAYRKLCLKYHPDKNSTLEGKIKFIEIKEAYDNIMNSRRNNRDSTSWEANPYSDNEEKKNYT